MGICMQDLMLAEGGNLQFFLFFLCLIIFALAERCWPRRTTPGYSKRITTNALLTLSNVVLIPLVPISIVTAGFWAESQGYGLINNVAHQIPVVVVIITTLLLRGFISFFTHLLNHKVPMFWRLHRVHHMDSALDVSSTVRFHPLEMFITTLVSVPLVVVLGLPPWVLLFYELFDVCVTLFSHSNLRLPKRIEKWLRYIIVTPGLHTVHHSNNPMETDKNFSAVFPIWDVIFGTFNSGDTPPVGLGLKEFQGDQVNHFAWLLISPFTRTQRLPTAESNH